MLNKIKELFQGPQLMYSRNESMKKLLKKEEKDAHIKPHPSIQTLKKRIV